MFGQTHTRGISHVLSFKEAIGASFGWIMLALVFGAWLWWREGTTQALEYVTGYLVELSLSVDNLFVFILVFQYFGVPPALQPRVLKWGILGAIVMRGIMIGLGALLLARFTWIPFVFGAILVVTGVGSLIHVYSVGYMDDDHREDRGFARFFCYLNLFTFSMLVLVLGDNLLLVFVGWEGVGLCSYLLIGFWYSDTWNAYCGSKAFIVNRIGDFGFLLGIFLLFWSLADAGQSAISFRELAGCDGLQRSGRSPSGEAGAACRRSPGGMTGDAT